MTRLMMKKIFATIIILVSMLAVAHAQQLRSEVFDLLDLSRPGLEKVQTLHAQGDDAAAAAELLQYYRHRQGIRTPEIKDPSKVKINPEQLKWAEDAMQHTFFVHKGYQPSFNYGEDIDWKYWPVKDNELRWQLHRHKWFTALGRAYRVSGDEKYAAEWAYEYMDWIRKNPYDKKGDPENFRFAWRPLEVSHRLQDQCLQFQLCVDSKAFTPEFLTEFLVNYHRHAVHIMGNYSDQGNHLLFEAQRMLCAGSFFPEFKEAEAWRKSGVDILNKEIQVQVYPDGGQFELDPHYHLAAINIFLKALQTADLNGFRNDFPQGYIDTVEKMIVFYANICFPDYTNPCFSDAKITTRKEMLKDYKEWHKVFPQNEFIEYLATEGESGSLPEHLSIAFPQSGFFVLRNGWDMDATQMVVKAGPPAFWHNQPDNGTFELWYNGRNLFPDSGSYVYAGEDPEVNQWRAWFRQTNSHNTLTLGGKDIETTDSKTLLWQPEGDMQILVTENQSYAKLKHRRSIFFVDKSYFVIVDEAVGDAKGWVNLNFQMPRGKMESDREDMHFNTMFEDTDVESNMKMQVFGPEEMSLKKDEGWMSTAYQKKQKRIKAIFNAKKDSNDPVRFITVIVPKKKPGDTVVLDAKFLSKTFDPSHLKVQVKVGKNKKTLEYSL